MKTLRKEYIVDKTRIGFIKFVFEAYEGVAVVSTLDARNGHIRLSISPDLEDTAYLVMEDFKKDFLVNEV